MQRKENESRIAELLDLYYDGVIDRDQLIAELGKVDAGELIEAIKGNKLNVYLSGHPEIAQLMSIPEKDDKIVEPMSVVTSPQQELDQRATSVLGDVVQLPFPDEKSVGSDEMPEQVVVKQQPVPRFDALVQQNLAAQPRTRVVESQPAHQTHGNPWSAGQRQEPQPLELPNSPAYQEYAGQQSSMSLPPRMDFSHVSYIDPDRSGQAEVIEPEIYYPSTRSLPQGNAQASRPPVPQIPPMPVTPTPPTAQSSLRPMGMRPGSASSTPSRQSWQMNAPVSQQPSQPPQSSAMRARNMQPFEDNMPVVNTQYGQRDGSFLLDQPQNAGQQGQFPAQQQYPAQQGQMLGVPVQPGVMNVNNMYITNAGFFGYPNMQNLPQVVQSMPPGQQQYVPGFLPPWLDRKTAESTQSEASKVWVTIILISAAIAAYVSLIIVIFQILLQGVSLTLPFRVIVAAGPMIPYAAMFWIMYRHLRKKSREPKIRWWQENLALSVCYLAISVTVSAVTTVIVGLIGIPWLTALLTAVTFLLLWVVFMLADPWLKEFVH